MQMQSPSTTPPSRARAGAQRVDLVAPVATIAVDEYAKAVLYNGLGHYRAARSAAQRACEHDDFALLDGALAELVEASARSGHPHIAREALRKLQDRAHITGSEWATALAAASRAVLSDDQVAETAYLEAIERLERTHARVALARTHLLYGEWLRRGGRRVDAREHLSAAHRAFIDHGLSGFADRARRELLATVQTARRRSDDTRLTLTPQEEEIARLAASGATNPEIGERLFISPRTVEWHLRKVFTKLGVQSRRQLDPVLRLVHQPTGPASSTVSELVQGSGPGPSTGAMSGRAAHLCDDIEQEAS